MVFKLIFSNRTFCFLLELHYFVFINQLHISDKFVNCIFYNDVGKHKGSYHQNLVCKNIFKKMLFGCKLFKNVGQ